MKAHKSAHACVAVAKNYRVERVRILYRNGRPAGGKCEVYHKRGLVPAVLRLAGRVSDAWTERPPSRLKLRRMVEEGRANGITDYENAARDVARYSGRPGEPRTTADAWEEARATLRQNWPTVEKLADRLAEPPGGELSGSKVHRICSDMTWMPAQR